MRRKRRHSNTKGLRAIKRGKTTERIKFISEKLKINKKEK